MKVHHSFQAALFLKKQTERHINVEQAATTNSEEPAPVPSAQKSIKRTPENTSNNDLLLCPAAEWRERQRQIYSIPVVYHVQGSKRTGFLPYQSPDSTATARTHIARSNKALARSTAVKRNAAARACAAAGSIAQRVTAASINGEPENTPPA